MGECNICWSNIESVEDAAKLTCCSPEANEAAIWWFWQESCPALHLSCLSKYLLIRAESGHFPATCPFCLRKLSVVEVYKNLGTSEKITWLRQHERWMQLRESGRSDPGLEEITLMQGLGCRRCPSCGAWIEKQSGGWLTGCDKMTCRCGCRFCFQCGSVEASCDCSLGHDFLDRELVLSNYWILDAFDNMSSWSFSLFDSTKDAQDQSAEAQSVEPVVLSTPSYETASLSMMETQSEDTSLVAIQARLRLRSYSTPRDSNRRLPCSSLQHLASLLARS